MDSGVEVPEAEDAMLETLEVELVRSVLKRSLCSGSACLAAMARGVLTRQPGQDGRSQSTCHFRFGA